MFIHEAVARCQADARLVMVSVTGDVYQVNRTGCVHALRGDRRPYSRFRAADLVSQMWRTFTLEQLGDPDFMAANF